MDLEKAGTMSPVSRAAYQRYLRWDKNPIAKRTVGRLSVCFIRGLDDEAKKFVPATRYRNLENEVATLNGWNPGPVQPSIT